MSGMYIDPIATGERIREIRKQKKIRVTEICEQLQLSEPRAVYYWENGHIIPSTQNLYSLSLLFGVPMEELLVTQSPPKKTVGGN